MLTNEVVDIPDPDKPEGWVFQLMPTWPGTVDTTQTDKDRIAHLKELAKDLAEPWRSAFLWIPDGSAAPASNLMYWVTVPWDNHKGSITLAGDAAHAMPPRMYPMIGFLLFSLTSEDRGQGLNHSIQDAVNLVDAIRSVYEGGNTVGEAITAYDEELVKRGFDEVNTSVQSAILSHDSKKLMEAPVLKQGYVKTEL